MNHHSDFDYASLPSETTLVSVLADTHIELEGTVLEITLPTQLYTPSRGAYSRVEREEVMV